MTAPTLRWKQSNTATYNLGYHLIWCCKYRRKVLVGDIEARLRELLYMKASEMQMVIETMEVMPDHVYLFVKALPIHAPHWVAGQLKGYTSRVLRAEFKTLKSRLPTLWTRSYYVESVGHISETTIRQYILDQKNA